MMLQKFKVECGLNVVNKMSTMFKDMELSKDLQGEYRRLCGGSDSVDGVVFAAEVLTNGNWPIEDPVTCSIPHALTQCKTKFDTFYKNKHSNRNLKWLWQHGSVEVATNFTPKKYQLVLNVFQCAVVSLYNGPDKVFTYGELKHKTNIPERQLNAALVGLANPRVKLLLKGQNNAKFESDDEKMTLNEKFASNNIRMTLIPQAVVKKKTVEQSEEEKQREH